MHIDDFINQYTPQEVDRIERKDVISRFDQKLTMQKITSEQSINAYEGKPVGSPQRPRSPNVRRSLFGSPPKSAARRSGKASLISSPGRKKRSSVLA